MQHNGRGYGTKDNGDLFRRKCRMLQQQNMPDRSVRIDLEFVSQHNGAAFPDSLPGVRGVATIDTVGIEALFLDELPPTNNNYAGPYPSCLCIQLEIAHGARNDFIHGLQG